MVFKGLENELDIFKKLKLFFIGTSYALAGTGVKTIEPLAEEYGIGDRVREITDRIGYFQALKVLSEAHILLIQGSDDAAYSASKIYPYLLANKPLLCVFHKNSNVVDFISKTNAGMCITFDENSTVEQKATELHTELSQLIDKLPFIPQINDAELKPYKASELTKRQTQFFDKICAKSNKTKS